MRELRELCEFCARAYEENVSAAGSWIRTCKSLIVLFTLAAVACATHSLVRGEILSIFAISVFVTLLDTYFAYEIRKTGRELVEFRQKWEDTYKLACALLEDVDRLLQRASVHVTEKSVTQ